MSDILQQKLNLELTVAEINVILRSLGKHPFEEIAGLIQKIKGQGEHQLSNLETQFIDDNNDENLIITMS